MKATIVTIGDELLNGQTVDTNGAWLAYQLNELGISIVEIVSVADRKDEIVNALERVSQLSKLIITTGGLGPTKDDITKSAICEFSNDELAFDNETYEKIRAYFARTGRKPTLAHKEQCYMPSKALLLDNSKGSAPGMWISTRDTIVLSMPGVPHEMRIIFEEQAKERISKLAPIGRIYHLVIQTAGVGESVLSERIQPVIKDLPDYISISYLPSISQVKLRLTGIGNTDTIKNEVEHVGEGILKILGTCVYGTGDISLSQSLGQLLKSTHLKVGTAESCTGGKLAHKITSVPGSSAYFEGSIISYSNRIKTDHLKVHQSTLDQFGAVSKETVQEMLFGLCDVLPIDIGVAITGIAGPDGGTKDKPVGTIYLACGNKTNYAIEKLQLGKNRLENIEYTSIKGLDMLRQHVLKEASQNDHV